MTFALDDVWKRYGGVVALRGVSTYFQTGEIVGLVGKNGAGKSTLIKILAGATHPDQGQVLVDGRVVHIRAPRDATHLRISVVHQELALIPGLSVAENVWLGLGYPRAAGPIVRWSALRSKTTDILRRVGLRVSVDAPAGTLGIASQRLVMIARGLAAQARLLILDEPSASFTDEEIGMLHQVVRSLAADGVGTVYVSHRVEEVLSLTDRVVVMRDGAVVDDEPTSTLDRAALVGLISGPAGIGGLGAPSSGARSAGEPATAGEGSGGIGLGVAANGARPVGGQPGPGPAPGGQRPAGHLREVLRVEHLAGGRDNRVVDASLSVRTGEILGIAGLVGSGRTELVRMLFGCEHPHHGSMVLEGKAVRFGSPRSAVRHGVVLVPEDRRNEGALTSFSVRYNMTLPSLPRFRRWPLIGLPVRRRELQATEAMMADLGIVASGPETAVETLSGGNQQKVVVGKWLMRDAEIFIFDEPSVGIDVQAKAEMFRRIALLATSGKAVVVISSEFEELEQNCDRIVVMRDGVTVGELAGEEITEAAMLSLCYGDDRPDHRRSA